MEHHRCKYYSRIDAAKHMDAEDLNAIYADLIGVIWDKAKKPFIYQEVIDLSEFDKSLRTAYVLI